MFIMEMPFFVFGLGAHSTLYAVCAYISFGCVRTTRDTLIYQDCVYIHMKTKWTVSLDSDLSDAADMLVASRRFATRTHLVEVAVLKLLEVEGASKGSYGGTKI